MKPAWWLMVPALAAVFAVLAVLGYEAGAEARVTMAESEAGLSGIQAEFEATDTPEQLARAVAQRLDRTVELYETVDTDQSGVAEPFEAEPPVATLDGGHVLVDLFLSNGLVVQIGPYHQGVILGYLEFWILLLLATAFLTLTAFLTRLTARAEVQALAHDAGRAFPEVAPEAGQTDLRYISHVLEHAASTSSEINDRHHATLEDTRTLMSSVAHEFRNPLARIQFANELAKDRSDPAHADLFDASNEAAGELDSLVREILNYSRLRYGDQLLDLAHVPVASCIRHLEKVLATGDSQITVHLPSTDTRVLADERLFVRAVTNLVTNAVRHAREQVWVEVGSQGSNVLIRIADDGPGIAPAHREKVFEPFYRVEESRSRASGGFGLGLSIVRSICDQHNAQARITDAPGRGAVFELEWPGAE